MLHRLLLRRLLPLAPLLRRNLTGPGSRVSLFASGGDYDHEHDAYYNHQEQESADADDKQKREAPFLAFRNRLLAVANQAISLRMLWEQSFDFFVFSDGLSVRGVPKELEPFAIALIEDSGIVGCARLLDELHDGGRWNRERETGDLLTAYRVAAKSQQTDQLALIVDDRPSGAAVRGGRADLQNGRIVGRVLLGRKLAVRNRGFQSRFRVQDAHLKS